MAPKRDISWAKLNRKSNILYLRGAEEFMKFTEPLGDRMRCPCKKCVNGIILSRRDVEEHIFNNGFNPSYDIWHYHGDFIDYAKAVGGAKHIDTRGKRKLDVRETGLSNMFDDLQAGTQREVTEDDMREDVDAGDQVASNLLKIVEDASVPLFDGASISKLDFMVRLFHLKVENQWTHKSFDQALALQKMVNPTANLPKDYVEAKKFIADMGFSYEKIHACPNECMLYMGDDKDLETCKTCHTGRYIEKRTAQSSEASNSRKKHKQVPRKVLRFFPIAKRLQRLFTSSKTAENMTWHADGRSGDGQIRHPADGEEWKRLDAEYPEFAAEARNVRLGLSSDGFEPFKSGEPHSLWPVTLVVYNLPPWMCMKPSFTQMPVLIPGPNSPTQDIDIYLRPLVEELKELWSNGIRVYDAHKKEWFTLRAVLLWTINDFPAYAMLSGWSTKGKLACPICQKDTQYLSVGNRSCYLGNRRHLDMSHAYRRDRRHFFENVHESRPPLTEPTGLEAYEAVKDTCVTFGKKTTSTLFQ